MDPYHNFYRGTWERVTMAYNLAFPFATTAINPLLCFHAFTKEGKMIERWIVKSMKNVFETKCIIFK